MLKRLIKRGFAARLFAWGRNHSNLGYLPKSDLEASLPKALALPSGDEIAKAVSAFGESGVLTTSGQLQVFGTTHILRKNDFSPSIADLQSLSLPSTKFVDMDIDQSHLILLSAEGEVFEVRANRAARVELPHKARLVAAGNGVSLAVVTGASGEDSVFVWGEPRADGAFFTFNVALPQEPFELTPISALIRKSHASVKKVRVVDNSAVLLLSDGTLVSWGDNTHGNLGVPRHELSLVDNFVPNPQKPLELAHLAGPAADFDLSDNLLVVLGQDGRAYFSGLDSVLSLRPVAFFEGLRVERVGCQHNKFFLIASNGKVFSNKPFDEEPYQKYYGGLDLFELDLRHFGGAGVAQISGKYDNAFALSK